ncbi:hypothetical protein J8F10_18045 [Gemmata sp. G18]|uniref:Transposase IS66 zinc-finger binding domain-containing protein n=1 Tax=Gemmata palustris TaxID=2822762 RepID=A0ABS5BTX2_9BACT|nr:hypothetical protein [Gemmata palustris]MBP3957168.1 hypothetical protein [Gemmata palustris]
MNAARIAKLERFAARVRCRHCGRPLVDRTEDRVLALTVPEVKELARLIGCAVSKCACGRASVDLGQMPDENKRAALALFRGARSGRVAPTSSCAPLL